MAALARRAGRIPPPPGPFRPEFWRSPLRGPWLTSVFGLVLLFGIPLMFVTGMLSYAAYNPGLGRINDQTPDKGLLGFYLFDWPTRPPWLYRLTQGVHVTLGVMLVPVLLAKLWSVIPKLFTWLPVRSPAHGLERMPQHAAALPIACVEGWSTPDQHWSGLRLADLAAMAGLPGAGSVLVESVQPPGPYSSVLLSGNQIHDPRALLALRVNGAALSLDHGYPARIIVPANPGVNNTKWVHRLTFRT
ncbi:molybdopterin-dependent oxidoreductase [Streptomyces sp. NPDC058000]|uniref:molybdopterin-dependent oxidoreductase n=1 Tax=Streptomyces sp. NPDC058000 TaxID=3346299 RepID=UPI0036E59638